MYPDEVTTVYTAGSTANVITDTETWLTGISLIDANKSFRFPKVRLELRISATLAPTSIHFKAQYRSAAGEWFDCQQTGWTEIDFVGGATELATNPYVGIFGFAEGDEIRIGWKGNGCDAANYYTIRELRVVKLAS